jgi:hypothetical protein
MLMLSVVEIECTQPQMWVACIINSNQSVHMNWVGI